MRFFLFIMLFFCTQVFAQVVDMRAFSRQRGYRAYRAEQVLTPAPVRSYPVQRQAELPSRENQSEAIPVSETPARANHVSGNQAFEASVPETASADSVDSRKIRQKGLKIFQEKDEDKVMNFVVENPEFKKLNKKQQQDLLNRIKYERTGSGKP